MYTRKHDDRDLLRLSEQANFVLSLLSLQIMHHSITCSIVYHPKWIQKRSRKKNCMNVSANTDAAGLEAEVFAITPDLPHLVEEPTRPPETINHHQNILYHISDLEKYPTTVAFRQIDPHSPPHS